MAQNMMKVGTTIDRRCSRQSAHVVAGTADASGCAYHPADRPRANALMLLQHGCVRAEDRIVARMANARIPVTVLTGFLGAGKTTLLNRILTEQHGQRIAVIENEFGEVGIDHQLVIGADEEIFEMNNGCICCTVRGDLIRILGNLLKRRERFDRIVIETTGLADPGPVAQTFLVDPDLMRETVIDGIVTVVDAANLAQHLDEGSMEVREQLAFADVIILNKVDAVDGRMLQEVERRIRSVNQVAPLHQTTRCQIPIATVLDVGGFDLDRALAQRPEFLEPERGFEWLGIARLEAGTHAISVQPGPDPSIAIAIVALPDGADAIEAATAAYLNRPRDPGRRTLVPAAQPWRVDAGSPALLELRLEQAGRYAIATEHGPEEFAIDWGGIAWLHQQTCTAGHEHDAQVTSVGISYLGEVDLDRFNAWFGALIRERGADLFRCKGILAMSGNDQRFVYHGVHMLTEGKFDRPWRADEARLNQLVFIGRNLDRGELNDGFRSCMVQD
jgi:G3E family GTPase